MLSLLGYFGKKGQDTVPMFSDIIGYSKRCVPVGVCTRIL